MCYRLRTLLILLAIGPPVLAAIGCESRPVQPIIRPQALPSDVRKILDAAERFILLSIEGEGEGKPDSTESSFHGFDILGKAEINDDREREQLLGALYRGIAESDGRPAVCFAPRHGISATLGDETVDLVICFECFQILVYEKQQHHVCITDSPSDAFSAALKRAGLPLAKPPVKQH